MISRKTHLPGALAMLATLMIHVGLAAQERSGPTQNPLSLIEEPLLPAAAIPAGLGLALTGNGSPSGTGGSSAPRVTLSPASLTFKCYERVSLCFCGLPQTLTLTNNGSQTLKIGSISIRGSGDFVLTANTCGTTLGAGESCTMEVTWNHSTATATLEVSDNAPGSPQKASLTGTNSCTSRSGVKP